MRIHVPSPKPRDEGEYEVRVNPGDAMRDPFAIIALSENSATEICLDDLDDARRLVRAAARALHWLEVSVKGEHHLYCGKADRCGECGQGEYADIHAVITDSERDCDQVNPDGSGEHCHRGGDHGVHQDSNGDEWRTDGGHSSRHPGEDRQYREAMATLSAGGHTAKGLAAMNDAAGVTS
jgi:hypothetical protein